jgi:hypothetical protein
MGYRHIFNANYIPYVFLEPEYTYKKSTFAFHVGYGGYGRLNLGTSYTFNSPGWFLRIGSNALQGFLLPKYTFGQGVFFSFARKFK